jgi:hypothetical protein
MLRRLFHATRAFLGCAAALTLLAPAGLRAQAVRGLVV